MQVRVLDGRGQEIDLTSIVTPDTRSITVTMHYLKTAEGFKLFPDGKKIPVSQAGEEHGALEIQLEFDGMFGGPLVSFYDQKGHLLNLARRSSASLALHLPEGGVTARDGIGDWTKVITLSKDKLD